MNSTYISTRPKFVPQEDMDQIAWERLTSLTNTEWTARRLTEKHRLTSKSERSNAKKQARQIRNCLDLAREYFVASTNVSMATRPVLAYYGTMHLALAQMLWDGDGSYSLDQQRKFDKHHGLTFKNSLNLNQDWAVQCGNLKAEPFLHTNKLRGTFGRWHNISRHPSIPARHSSTHSNGIVRNSYQSVLLNLDEPPKPLGGGKISLLDCFQLLPSMVDFLNDHDIESRLIKGSITKSSRMSPPLQETTTTTIQPTNRDLLGFQERFIFKRPNCNLIECLSLTNSFVLKVISTPNEEQESTYPNAYTVDIDTVYFLDTDIDLNEFGIIYIALFIAGNYARYYPDLWMQNIESRDFLYQAIDLMVRKATPRAPLLTVACIDRQLIMPDTR